MKIERDFPGGSNIAARNLSELVRHTCEREVQKVEREVQEVKKEVRTAYSACNGLGSDNAFSFFCVYVSRSFGRIPSSSPTQQSVRP